MVSSRRTLWEEGRHPGRLVATSAALGALLVVIIDLSLTGQLGMLFDLAFVTICVAAVLAVRPCDFFVVGVLPPLLMFGTVLTLAVTARGAIADEVDGLVQAVVSGLAHHAGSLMAGYALTLAIMSLRQLAMRNSGRIRGDLRPKTRSGAVRT